jgi:hypothetical protein
MIISEASDMDVGIVFTVAMRIATMKGVLVDGEDVVYIHPPVV